MTNRPKEVGTAFETLLCRYFKLFWPDVERSPLKGGQDIGDFINLPKSWILQAKRVKKLSLPHAMKDAAKQAENAGRKYYGVVHKRWGNNKPGDQFVTIPLWLWVELVQEDTNV